MDKDTKFMVQCLFMVAITVGFISLSYVRFAVLFGFAVVFWVGLTSFLIVLGGGLLIVGLLTLLGIV